jgi:hypothetical protein
LAQEILLPPARPSALPAIRDIAWRRDRLPASHRDELSSRSSFMVKLLAWIHSQPETAKAFGKVKILSHNDAQSLIYALLREIDEHVLDFGFHIWADDIGGPDEEWVSVRCGHEK